ncbi:MAG: Wzy polymerase domain-containing protein [Desulfurivibrionaceae bacterium]
MKFVKTELFAGAAPQKRRGGLLALALALALLSGCAKSAYEGAAVEQLQAEQEKASVQRLGNGREGFVIREISDMTAESLDDFERAIVMMDDHNYEKAIELLENVIEQSPGVTAPYVNLAMAYARIGKTEPAERHLKTALALFPDHPAVSNEYGLLLRKSGRFTEAREIYEKALDSFPEYLPVHLNLGILCDLYLNDQECALKQYGIYSEAMPEDEQVEIWIAELQLRLGR